jgi:acyl-CoA thioesterase FadM
MALGRPIRVALKARLRREESGAAMGHTAFICVTDGTASPRPCRNDWRAAIRAPE